MRAIAELREELSDLECDAVRSAVQAGSSWSDVAGALGVSKQSAHKRFAGRLQSPPRRIRRVDASAPEIVVTAQARRAVRGARAAARVLRHADADSSHLLLGLLADRDGPASAALEAIGVEFNALREVVADQQDRGPVGDARAPPISGPARAALEQSLREARRLGHAHLGVEHLLLGIVRDPHGRAVEALAAVDVSPIDLERCLGKLLMEAPFAISP